LLYRYTAQDDIIVGSPIAGRIRVDTEGLIGFFINNLVLRTDLSGNPTFRELLGRVREVALGAYTHQDIPFEKLVEELRPKRDLSRNPLFQVMFALQNTPRFDLKLPGLTLSPFEVDNGTARFDLTLFLAETDGGLTGAVRYSTDLFDAATITRMLGHFSTLLEGVVANPDQRLSDLPLLTNVERQQLVVKWNDTFTDCPMDSCIHQLFEMQVEQTPDAVAAVFEDQELTYQELNHWANQLAHHLQALGVGPETLVGIHVERSLEMVVGLLGILKAGGAYVPLDPAYPKERLAFMLEDAQVPVLLTQERLLPQLPRCEAQVVCLDAGWDAITREREENPGIRVNGDHLAYVIYTSGSTGRPKGVQILHRSLVNCLNSTSQKVGLTDQDTLLAVTTLSFDIAGLEIFLPLVVGARVIVVSREVASDGTQLLKKLTDSGATAMQATPATWRLLLRAGWLGSNRFKVLCGGDTLSQELAGELLNRGCSVWNLYGPTETTIWSATYLVERKEGAIPIGKPIGNTQIYLLDCNLQPVPVGVPGEIYIGGYGLARGYLNQPALTAEKFIPNLFNGERGGRLYKTGDLARYLPDGAIEFLGRTDYQVKISGYRIELEEIEVVIAQHSTVRETVVTVLEDEPGDKRLVAYVVCNQGQIPGTDELHRFVKEKLPTYMVPSAFVILDALPQTPNGKVDRRALPAPDWTRPELESAFVAPVSPIEKVLAGIWAEVLGLERVGIHDNFFDLGGHSLLGTRVISRVLNTLGVEVPLRSLFEVPTVADMAMVIIQIQAKEVGQADLARMLAELGAFQ